MGSKFYSVLNGIVSGVNILFIHWLCSQGDGPSYFTWVTSCFVPEPTGYDLDSSGEHAPALDTSASSPEKVAEVKAKLPY